jgi:deoxyribodipyrimidine photo-lyase
MNDAAATFNDDRVRSANAGKVNRRGDYVLYWSQMSRRLAANHALDYAMSCARDLGKPLVIYEALKLRYPWASARFHQFILEGMRDNHAEAMKRGATYWPFVETPGNPGRGLVRTLCEKAALLVTDDYPQFVVPAQIAAVAGAVKVAVHAVDANCVVPLAKLGPATKAAAHLRPRIHKLFAEAWENRAEAEPDFADLPHEALSPPFAPWEPPADLPGFVEALPIDQRVPALRHVAGGRVAGMAMMADFLRVKLGRYTVERNRPDDPEKNSASGLSAHLHYGHVGIQDIVAATLATVPKWTPAMLNLKTRNKDDFFCRDENVNGFLDEAITWRDVGYQWHYATQRGLQNQGTVSTQLNDGKTPSFNFSTFDFSPQLPAGTLCGVLPDWATATLAKHAGDPRPHVYTLDEFEAAKTHDELWNAAQKELVVTGRIHNYLRMLWAKKVLEWSPSPEAAYRVLETLNNKYAIDGRDPNSYTGILWCFGLFDRPWPPERPIFGNVRYMTSDSTAKKFKLADYYQFVRGLPSINAVRTGTSITPAKLF